MKNKIIKILKDKAVCEQCCYQEDSCVLKNPEELAELIQNLFIKELEGVKIEKQNWGVYFDGEKIRESEPNKVIKFCNSKIQKRIKELEKG